MRDETSPSRLQSRIPEDEGAPYADEDAARGIAIVMALFTQDRYAWSEWVDKFSTEIAAPGYFPHSDEGADAAEAVLTGDGKRINRNYARLWLRACEKLLIEKGLLTRAELDAKLAELRSEAGPDVEFNVGDTVVVRDVEPVAGVHLPLFVRGKTGVVARRLPDMTTLEAGKVCAVYSVRFAARDLWGADAPAKDSVNFSIWQGYLRQT